MHLQGLQADRVTGQIYHCKLDKHMQHANWKWEIKKKKKGLVYLLVPQCANVFSKKV